LKVLKILKILKILKSGGPFMPKMSLPFFKLNYWVKASGAFVVVALTRRTRRNLGQGIDKPDFDY
jgi:hypothetical protein